AVRALLRVLENKGFLKHKEKRLRYVYFPTMTLEKVKKTALDHLINTFFNGSPEGVIAAILDDSDTNLSEEELNRVAELIKKVKSGE
ncbi:BlaI/MecI/CopY family transcriptional regulator, partial [candidate division KSB1 bacterium]